MSQKPGYIPLQYGLTPARRSFGFDVDNHQRYGPTGQYSRYGIYNRTLGPAPVDQNQGMAQVPGEGPVRGSGPMPWSGGGSMPNNMPQMENYTRGSSLSSPVGGPSMPPTNRPPTGGGLTVQGGPDLYRNGLPLYQPNGPAIPRPPAPNQPTGLLSEPPRTRREQVQNMQSKIADYQAAQGTDPNWDQNQLSRMQGRLNYVSRMRRQGR